MLFKSLQAAFSLPPLCILPPTSPPMAFSLWLPPGGAAMKAGVQEGDRIVKVSCVSKGCPSCWPSAAPVSINVGQLAVCWEEGTLLPPWLPGC